MLSFTQLDWPLFASALVSSTLFPGGSEALLLLHLQEENSSVYALVGMATLGNVLGSLITYMMGRFGFQLSHRWFRVSQEKLDRTENYFARFGTPALLFAWLPIIGDPLCLVAGMLRYHLMWFILVVSLGKLARYSFLAWLFI